MGHAWHHSLTGFRICMAFVFAALIVGAHAAKEQQQQLWSEVINDSADDGNDMDSIDCGNEQQVVMCSQIPFAAKEDRLQCCMDHAPQQMPPDAVTAAAAVEVQQAFITQNNIRTDLTGDLASPPDFFYGSCTQQTSVAISFYQNNNAWPGTTWQPAPVLNKGLIQRVKAAAIFRLNDQARSDYQKIRSVNSNSGFVHPGTVAGPAELALMKYRLNTGSNVQKIALDSLLSGNGVKAKTRPAPDGSTWAPPTNTPADGYYGPLPMQKVLTKWSGYNYQGVTCPNNYPWKAPQSNCGHISFVELDSQMAYKQALAWWATGDDRYANNALRIIEAWTTTNTQWGLQWENGPLEAAWGCAAMARALELLRGRAPSGLINKFVTWMNNVLMKDMDWYIDTQSRKGIEHFWGNWQASIGECMMAVGILSDDRARYNKAVGVFYDVVNDYLKWGKGNWAGNRVLGECSETLRDIYHSQFGLGGLLQMAEMAWQQDDDLYSANGYALVAAMELHARINIAGRNKDSWMLPQGFKFFEQMPAPPSNSFWQFNIKTQKWAAISKSNGQVVQELNDNIKYILGTGYLPTGWEVGYNHFVGRLGLRLPETAALIASNWPDWGEFHWGVTSITHAHSAQSLWRAGVSYSTLCAKKAAIASHPGNHRNYNKNQKDGSRAGDSKRHKEAADDVAEVTDTIAAIEQPLIAAEQGMQSLVLEVQQQQQQQQIQQIELQEHVPEQELATEDTPQQQQELETAQQAIVVQGK